MLRVLVSLAGSAVLAFAFPSQAQTTPVAAPPQQSPAPTAIPLLHATARNVVLDVVVTDTHGIPVSGLKQEDFQILENKELQSIASFEAVSASTSTAASRNTPQTILIVDAMNTRFEDFAYVRYSVAKLLKHEHGMLDQPTMLLALTNRGLQVLTKPTRDAAVLAAAMKSLPATLPWRLEQGGIWGTFERVNDSLMALEQIAQANAGSVQRKNIIWISPGFPILSRLELEAASQEKLFDAIRKLSDELLKARIAVYTIDPRGVMVNNTMFSNNFQFGAYLRTLNAASGVAFGDLALQKLAVETGGEALYGRNDVDNEIAKGISDGSTYYTISYSPRDHNFDGKFRKIKIVISSQPGLKARTRDGYYALPEPLPPTPDEIRTQIEAALVSPFTYNAVDIPLVMTKISHRLQHAAISLNIDASTLSWNPLPDGQLACTLDVGAIDFSQKGLPEHLVMHAYRVSAQPDVLRSPNRKVVKIDIQLALTMPPQHVRLVVRDASTGRLGTTDLTSFPTADDTSFPELMKRTTEN